MRGTNSEIMIFGKSISTFKNIGKREIIFVALGILSVIPTILFSFLREITLDPAVILKEMECIAEGYVPYQTMHLNYPPLYFYFLAFLKRLFSVPYGYYEFYLVINYLLLFACALVLYKISCYIYDNKVVGGFVSWMFVMILITIGATDVLFEIPSMLLGLSASLMIMMTFEKENRLLLFLLAGFLSSCSFLVKQFGFGFIVLNGYLVLAYTWEQKKAFVVFLVGSFLPVFIAYLFWGDQLFSSTLLNGYGTETSRLAGEDVSIRSKISHIYSNCMVYAKETCPIVIGLLIVPFCIKRNWKIVLWAIMGIGGFSLQYYFCSSDYHYQQYMVPFTLLLIPTLISCNSKRIMQLFVLILSIFCLCRTLEKVYYRDLFIPLKKDGFTLVNRLLLQREKANIMRQIIPEGKTLWIPHITILPYSYLSNIPTPNMREVGFSSGPWEMTIERAKLQVRDADYILCLKKTAPNYGWFEYFCYYFTQDMREYVYSRPSKDIDENMVLFKMKD